MRREARVINFKRSILNSCFACAQSYPHFTQQQRLFSLQNDLAKQKIDLARMTGLPPNDQYEITDDIPFSATSLPSRDEALKRASAQRSDLKAAEAQVRAAESAVAAARTERLVQSQEALAGAELDYINSVFAHNLAKLTLARATGRTAEEVPRLLNLP